MKDFDMNIVIGSRNKTKIQAVKEIFPKMTVIPKSVPSGVSAQPIDDKETMEGAINRARRAKECHPGSIGIGLEGGVTYLKNGLFLCNWGALITSTGKLYTASGARIRLPDEFKEKIDNGFELSTIMGAYARKKNIRHREGAIGIFTNGKMVRAEMFAHVVTLLRGQMEYWSN